jgi:hypothetical protein
LTRWAIGRTQPRMADPQPPPQGAAPSEKEKRLAEALRANLRRRRAGAKAPAAGAKDSAEGT